MTIVRREAWRRCGPAREVATEEPVQAVDHKASDAIEGTPDRLDLLRAMQAMSSGDQAALLLRYAADLTQPAVAEALRTPEGTVKVRLHRARRQLHRTLLTR
jgi:RNA polymerase sigma-70 factor (ECF subfamily)